MAVKIVKERAARGVYTSWEDLDDRVAGMGSGKVSAMQIAGYTLPRPPRGQRHLEDAGVGGKLAADQASAPPATNMPDGEGEGLVPNLPMTEESAFRQSKRRRVTPAKYAGGVEDYWITGSFNHGSWGSPESHAQQQQPEEQSFAEGSGNARQFASVADGSLHPTVVVVTATPEQVEADASQPETAAQGAASDNISATFHDTVYYKFHRMQVMVTSQATQVSFTDLPPPQPQVSPELLNVSAHCDVGATVPSSAGELDAEPCKGAHEDAAMGFTCEIDMLGAAACSLPW
jgi:hypothetical protein